MKIDISYQGVLTSKREQVISQDQTNQLAGKEYEMIHNGQAVKLTISNEMKEFQLETADLFSKDWNVLNADPSQIFSYRPQDQWLVFSQYLYEADFFHSLDKGERIQVESTLQQLTEGLDSLTHTGINFFGGLKTELDSYEAAIELAASTSALHLFSENFLTGDVKNGFRQLIDEYTFYNKEKVVNHQSIEERFYAARSRINPIDVNRTDEQNRLLSITNKLGKTAYTEEEIESQINRYTELFKDISDEKDLIAALQLAKEQLLQFVTKGISQKDKDDLGIVEYINERTNDTFIRVNAYLNNLLG